MTDTNKTSKTAKRQTGDNAEDEVIRLMQDEGYELLCRNFAVHNVGELDSVFIKDDDVYVVEVRSRRNSGPYPYSSETVDNRKRIKIKRCTSYLIRRYGLYGKNIVFLVAQVTHDDSGIIKKTELIPF